MSRAKTFPILEHPGDGPALIEPERLYSRQPRIPPRCVLCFFAEVIAARARQNELIPLTTLPGEGEPIQVYRHGSDRDAVAVAFPGVGAPFAAATLEELIGLGARAVICAGGAGVLDPDIPVGQLMIPTSALRDEGTSYHYQHRGRFSRPDRRATAALRQVCRAAGHRPHSIATWTTDGVYRETPEMVRRRREEGCSAVEMEAAAFFAVARFRQIALAQLLYAGDDVSGERWNHRRWLEQAVVRQQMLDLALNACRQLSPS